jgi:hypothetical protein
LDKGRLRLTQATPCPRKSILDASGRLLHPQARELEVAILSKNLTDRASILGLMFDDLEEITSVH